MGQILVFPCLLMVLLLDSYANESKYKYHYKVVARDTLRIISYKLYGTPKKIKTILRNNPHIKFRRPLEIGQKIFYYHYVSPKLMEQRSEKAHWITYKSSPEPKKTKMSLKLDRHFAGKGKIDISKMVKKKEEKNELTDLASKKEQKRKRNLKILNPLTGLRIFLKKKRRKYTVNFSFEDGDKKLDKSKKYLLKILDHKNIIIYQKILFWPKKIKTFSKKITFPINKDTHLYSFLLKDISKKIDEKITIEIFPFKTKLPLLLEPANYQTHYYKDDPHREIKFSFKGLKNVYNYLFQLSVDPTFKKIIKTKRIFLGKSIVINFNITYPFEAGTYYWRIKGTRGMKTYTSQEVNKFEIIRLRTMASLEVGFSYRLQNATANKTMLGYFVETEGPGLWMEFSYWPFQMFGLKTNYEQANFNLNDQYYGNYLYTEIGPLFRFYFNNNKRSPMFYLGSLFHYYKFNLDDKISWTSIGQTNLRALIDIGFSYPFSKITCEAEFKYSLWEDQRDKKDINRTISESHYYQAALKLYYEITYSYKLFTQFAYKNQSTKYSIATKTDQAYVLQVGAKINFL